MRYVFLTYIYPLQMFPCPTSDSSYSLENKTEIRQVGAVKVVKGKVEIGINCSVQISTTTEAVRGDGADGQQTFWSGSH